MQGQRLSEAATDNNETYSMDLDARSARGIVVVEVFYKNGMRAVHKYDLK